MDEYEWAVIIILVVMIILCWTLLFWVGETNAKIEHLEANMEKLLLDHYVTPFENCGSCLGEGGIGSSSSAEDERTSHSVNSGSDKGVR